MQIQAGVDEILMSGEPLAPLQSQPGYKVQFTGAIPELSNATQNLKVIMYCTFDGVTRNPPFDSDKLYTITIEEQEPE